MAGKQSNLLEAVFIHESRTRSRADSLPEACCLSMRSLPPPSATVARLVQS